MLKNIWIELKIGLSLLYFSFFGTKITERETNDEPVTKKQPCGPKCKCRSNEY